MKAILVSVPPEVCERIANGEQTLLLMKRIPKLDTPYKVYVYCTKNAHYEIAQIRFADGWRVKHITDDTTYANGCTANIGETLNGKAIGSFVCNTIRDYASDECPDYNVLDTYGAPCYGLRITDLKIYDTPKELGEFKHCCKHNRECDDCKYWGFQHVKKGGVELLCPIDIPLTRPPATFCYVSEVGE